MSRIRLSILLLGPIPIVWVSMVICEFLRSEPVGPPQANHFLVSTAQAAESGNAAKPVKDKRLIVACRKAAEKLRPRLGDECHVIERLPFVIAGDMSEEQLDSWHRQTIGPAAEAMALRYFQTSPSEPITVLLFSDESSYNHYAEKLFEDRGVSIYGYYKPQVRTLVMNIGTGGGTLVHELTHALADFDFPRIPDWFNEGLASLHEQCQFRRDTTGPWIEGLENWRLPGLQKAIRAGRLRSLESLIADDDFRGQHEALNYAQARYLCLMMQREGVLEDFYRQFRATQKDDPRGAKALAQVFSHLSWEELDQKFQQWVLTLKRTQ